MSGEPNSAQTGGSLHFPSPVVPFVGRPAETDRLRALLADVARGYGRVVFVEGEAGIGKTRLVAEALASASDHGFLVLQGSAEELERARPFSALAEALRPLTSSADPDRAALARLLAGDGEPRAGQAWPTGDVGFVVIEAVIGLIEQLTARTPVALVLEDLHWADLSTLRAMRSLGSRLADRPFALIGTLRRAPPMPVLDRLMERLRSNGAELLRLGSLPDEAVAALTATVLGAQPGPRLRELVTGAAGNPLYVLELLTSLRDDGAIEVVEGTAETDATALPPSLRSAVIRRFSQLSEQTAQLLHVAAVFGAAFRPEDLAAVTGRPVVDLLPALREAVRAGFLGEREVHLTFRHALIRRAVYDELTLPVRRSLHREVGQALAAAGAPAVSVAEQLSLGTSVGDVETVDWLRQAGREVAAHSVGAATELLGRALQFAGPSYPKRSLLIAELAPLLALQGRFELAEALSEQVLVRRSDPGLEVRLRAAMAHSLARQGRFPAASEQIELARAAIPNPDARTLLLGPGAFIALVTGAVGKARAWAQDARAQAERTGNDVALSTALMSLCWAAGAQGYAAEACALGAQAVEAGRRASTLFAAFLFPELCHGSALADADRFAKAESVLRAGVRRADELGTPAFLPYYQSGLAILRFHRGEWDDALCEAETGLALVEEALTRSVFVPLALIARVAIARGDLARAQRAVRQADAEMEIRDLMMGANWALWAKALLLEARGDRAGAGLAMARAWDALPELRYLFSNWMMAVDMVRLALATGDRRRAEAVTEELAAVAERAPGTGVVGAALRCRGLLGRDAGLLVEAVRAYDAVSRPMEQALAAEDAGHALSRDEPSAAARRLLHEALAGYERLGASYDIARVTQALRRGGVRRGSRAPHGREATGWAALTQTEVAVAQLVAEGLTNPQIAQRLFVSRHTVETHMKHVLAKLGAVSRAQVAAEAARHAG